MLVVDASCLVEVLIGGTGAAAIRTRLAADPTQVAPHVVDVEVLDVVRREDLRGCLDPTAATQAIAELADWPKPWRPRW